ncbi:MAG: hypothetical protein MR629_05220 [Helicobacter sp.]|nr:hypothetical protein [Helicobacter sp.]
MPKFGGRILIMLLLCASMWGDVALEEVDSASIEKFINQPAKTSIQQSLDSLFTSNIRKPVDPEKYKNSSKQAFYENFLASQYMLSEKLPNWIYANAIIEVYFNDGSQRLGFGTLLQNGFFLTASHIVYDKKLTPKAVFARMQDSSMRFIICTHKLYLKAVDVMEGLALLETIAYTDDYCQQREKSYYHDRIEKRYFVDVFAAPNSINTPSKRETRFISNKESLQKVFYAYVDENYYFVPKNIELPTKQADFDDRAHYGVHGAEMRTRKDEVLLYDSFAYGRAFFDNKGGFLGILSSQDLKPIFITKHKIQQFLCVLQSHKVLENKEFSKACKIMHF